MMAAQNGVGFFELIQTQVTYNIILLAAVFHAVSFLLVYQAAGNINKQVGYDYSVCILLLICLLQFVLMDIPVAILLVLLILLLVLALLILTVLILVVFHCFKHSMP